MAVFAGQGLPAWERWAQLLVDRYSNKEGGDIIQPLAVAYPALFDQTNKYLGRYFENMFSDRLPQWNPIPDLTPEYVASGASLAKGYKFFLYSLTSELVKTATPAQKQAINDATTLLEDSAKELQTINEDINNEWKIEKSKDPTLRRDVWERDNKIYLRRLPKQNDFNSKLANYIRAVSDAGQAEATMIAEQITLLEDPTQKIRLPNSTRRANDDDPSTWGEYLKQEFTENISDFKSSGPSSIPELLTISETSSESNYISKTWNVGGSVSFLGLFRSGGIDVSQSEIEEHVRSSTTSINFQAEGIQEFKVSRGEWYDEQIIKYFMAKVSPDTFWGNKGLLNLIPRSVIAVRGAKITVECSSTALDRYEQHIRGGADAGFWIGCFRVGLGGGFSSDEVQISRDFGSSTIEFKFPSDRPVVIAVRSWRPIDILGTVQRLSPHLEERLASLIEEDSKKYSDLFLKARNLNINKTSFRPL
jgi:hypothetical protein